MVAVNFEQGQVDKAREFLIDYRRADPSRLKFEQYNLYDLAKEQRKFDEIFASVLELYATTMRSGIHRILRPDGALHVCCPYGCIASRSRDARY